MNGRIIIENFNSFGGKHCETSSLMKVLKFMEHEYSEEFLFGLGGGICFIYWFSKNMPAPFIGGRYQNKYENFIAAIMRRLGGEAEILETTSERKALDNLMDRLNQNIPALLYGDMAYLSYFGMPEDAHFGGHVFIVYGVDEEKSRVYISDIGDRPVHVTLENLEKARASKFPPMPPKHRIVNISLDNPKTDLRDSIIESIEATVKLMMNPPIKNIGLAGIKKTADIILGWPDMMTPEKLFFSLLNLFIYIEIGGTGGSAFRKMYADFLIEASDYFTGFRFKAAADYFRSSAEQWSVIAETALPDKYEPLASIRDLIWEKDALFLSNNDDSMKAMKIVNQEMEKETARAIKLLKQELPVDIFTNLSREFTKLHKIEMNAFNALKKEIGQ